MSVIFRQVDVFFSKCTSVIPCGVCAECVSGGSRGVGSQVSSYGFSCFGRTWSALDSRRKT